MPTEDEFRKVLEAFPDDAMTRFGLGALYRDEGRFEEAVGEFQKAVACDPEYGAAFLELGVVLEELDRTDDARDAYAAAARLGREKGDEHVFKRAERYLGRIIGP